MNFHPMLMTDFYKCTHMNHYNPKMIKLVSYMTPRMSRLIDQQDVVVFGIQGIVKKYLIEYFNDNFFGRPRQEIIDEYKEVLSKTLPSFKPDIKKISSLYDLGYLPIKVSILPEGTLCPMGTPFLKIENTHKDFIWFVNYIETLLSCSLWYPMTIANVGQIYRKIVNEYYDLTVEDDILKHSAISEFGLRGAESLESGIAASSAFLLSFSKTATIPAISYVSNYYNEPIENVGQGMISTEHSVMCSNAIYDGDEKKFIKKLITKIQPEGNISIVCDSFDYWNVVNDILPSLKEEIMSRNGCVFVRGDSGNPVEIVVKTVETLYNHFGGTINSKGYKILDSHIRAIYGDSITPQRARQIYERLKNMGFASNNVSLGAGSFSMQCIEQDGILAPFTRDTLSFAVKSTYAVINGKEIMIYKDPKTDTGNFKKSQRGLIYLYKVDEYIPAGNGYVFRDKYLTKLKYQDNLKQEDLENWESIYSPNLLQPIYRDGEIIKEESFSTIRQRLNNNNF